MKNFVLAGLVLTSVALAAALAFTLIISTDLRSENQTLRKQLEAFTAQTLQSQKSETTPVLANEPPDAELIRLRGEVVTLRQQRPELDRLRKEIENLKLVQAQEREQLRQHAETLAQSQVQTQQSSLTNYNRGNLPRESWAFAGYENPEAALQSVMWAGLSGNAEAILAGFTPDQLKAMQTEDGANRTEEEVLDRVAKQISKVKAFQLLKTDFPNPDEAIVTMFLDGLEGSEKTQRMKLQRINNTWKVAGPAKK